MKFIRVKAYDPAGSFTGMEEVYGEVTQDTAITKFRKYNPEYNACIVTAEILDTEDPKDMAYLWHWFRTKA